MVEVYLFWILDFVGNRKSELTGQTRLHRRSDRQRQEGVDGNAYAWNLFEGDSQMDGWFSCHVESGGIVAPRGAKRE